MKKIVISLIILGVLISISYYFLRRTPEAVLSQQFEFDLSDFKYEVLYDKEEWSPNGDGYHQIGIKFDKITKDNLVYLEKYGFSTLPIKTILTPNDIPSIWKKKENGYYKLMYFDSDIRNFKILIIDLTNNELLMYYQLE